LDSLLLPGLTAHGHQRARGIAVADIPRAVLSEQFEEQLVGRCLLAAVFVTFRFDPEFFEQQVLPVFLDVSTSHAEAIRRVQLEDVLKAVRHRVAVYYDQNGLDADAKPARLDVSRVPIVHRTGIFHPKNVFALVEELVPDDCLGAFPCSTAWN